MSGYISDILFRRIHSTPPVTLSAEQLAEIASQIPATDLSGLVVKVTGSELLATTEAAKIHIAHSDNQDLSGKVDTNDSRLSDARTPVTHSHIPADITGMAVVTNDARLSDARTPTTHTHDTLYNSVRLFSNLTAPVVSSGTTEKVLLNLLIPANRAVVGSTFRTWIVGNSSSTGTLIFKVRCGAGGTITDTIDWTAVTSVAQVANATAGFEVIITIRSATTIAVRGVGYAGTIQLPTVIGAPTTPAIVISSNWYINLTVICSSGTFTAQVGNIEEIR